MTDRRLSGVVLHRGRPQADCQVLAIDEAAGEVLADAATSRDGRWELNAPHRELLVFARCRGEALGVVAQRAFDEPLTLEIASVAPTHELSVRIDDTALPAWVRPQVRLTPRRVGTLDPGMLRWIRAPVRGAVTSALAGFTPDGRELRRFVQEGRWWLTAHEIVASSVRVPDRPEPVSWLAAAALDGDGRELEAARGGFELEVAAPVTVTIRLMPV